MQPFDYVVQTYHLCELHFSPDDIVTREKKKSIAPGRVPTIFEIENNIHNTVEDSDVYGVCETANNSTSTKSNPIVNIPLDSKRCGRRVSIADKLSNGTVLNFPTSYDGYVLEIVLFLTAFKIVLF